MRVRHATAMPNLRAFSRCCGGSRLTAIEMNTRLSMPSTISIELNVNSRIHTCGSASNSQLINRIPSTVVRIIPARRPVPAASRPARHQDHSPAQQHVHHHHEHRGRSHVLGAPSQFRSEEHTSELQSHKRNSYDYFSL